MQRYWYLSLNKKPKNYHKSSYLVIENTDTCVSRLLNMFLCVMIKNMENGIEIIKKHLEKSLRLTISEDIAYGKYDEKDNRVTQTDNTHWYNNFFLLLQLE